MLLIEQIETLVKFTFTNSKVDLLSIEFTANENKGDDILYQYNFIIENTGKTDSLTVMLQGLLDDKVPFEDYDLDSVSFKVAATEYIYYTETLSFEGISTRTADFRYYSL